MSELKPIPTHDKNGKALSEFERRRISERRLAEDMRSIEDRLNAPYKAMLAIDPRFGGVGFERAWMQFEAILNAGGEGLSRNLGRNMKGKTAPAPVSAAAGASAAA